MIEIAHPDFRPDLINAAKNRRYILWTGEPSVLEPAVSTPPAPVLVATGSVSSPN